MPKTRPQGMTTEAFLDRAELMSLRQEILEMTSQEMEELQREVALAENLQAYLGQEVAPLPGDLAAKALSRFSRYVRFT